MPYFCPMAKMELNHRVFGIVGEEADHLGVEAFVIGGFVRDLLLGRPSKDIDFMCVGNGLQLAKAVAFRMNAGKRLRVFKNFGTAQFMTGEWDMEFVGARKESYRTHSRNPIVEDGSLEDDLLRRDFTINALAIRLNGQHYGEIVDAFGGLADLNQGILRTPVDPTQTFSDDPLRMLRAIRFAAQLNFRIDPAAFAAMEPLKDRLGILAKERIADELNKMILSPNPGLAFRLLDESGLLPEIFPEMSALKGVDIVQGKAHKDNFYHTLQVLENLAAHSDDLWLRWAAVLHDIAKPKTKRFEPGHGWTFHGHEELGARMVPKIFKRLGLPGNEKMKFVQKMVRLHLRPIALVKEEITDSAIRRLLFDAGEDLESLMTLCEADITSKNEARVKRYLRNYEVVKLKLKEVEEKDHIRNFQPPVTGEEIMDFYGLAPCKTIGDIKNSIKEAILEGEIPNQKEAAWAYMLQKGEALGLKPQAS